MIQDFYKRKKLLIFFFRSKFVRKNHQFFDQAITSLCSNAEYVDEKPIVWSISMYLNMVCHQFDGDTSTVMANFSTLPIGMYSIRENPHDPNQYDFHSNSMLIESNLNFSSFFFLSLFIESPLLAITNE